MIKLKEGVDFNDLKVTHPNLLIVLAGAYAYCQKIRLPFLITSLFTDQVRGRVSNTHLTGRAFDLSVKSWGEQDILDFIKYMNEKFIHLAAVSSETGEKCLIPPINHGTGLHFHIQVSQ